MQRLACWSAAIALGLFATGLRGDTIYFKTAGKKKAASGTVAQESAKGVVLKGAKDLIAADHIADIDYDIRPADVRLTMYLKAVNAEAAARKAKTDAGRLKDLKVALDKYATALPKIDPKLPFATRHVAFKIAFLSAEKADLEGTETARQEAIDKLKAFADKEPNSWQITRVLFKLARMQVEGKAFSEAEATLKTLAEAPVDEATRQEAELMTAELSMKAGKYEVARKKLETLAAKLPKDSPAGQKARLGQAECLAALKDTVGAQKVLAEVLRSATDGEVKAAAYNTLGYSLLQDGKVEEARWAFLWVDVVYNQNKGEHAKALYYLQQIFARLNEPERAQECLSLLLNDPEYAGLDYQKKAHAERKKGS